MKRVILLLGAVSTFYMLFMEGFAAPSLSPVASLVLRIVCALCVQWLFLSFQNRLFRALPLLLTSLLALWGLWLLRTSPDWQSATFGGYLADYTSPAITCGMVWLLCRK